MALKDKIASAIKKAKVETKAPEVKTTSSSVLSASSDSGK